MALVETSGPEVLARTRRSLGLPTSADVLDEPLLAALLRRSAGILCPCAGSTLAASVLESLYGLSPEPEALANMVEVLLDKLVVCGDLLELHQVTVDDASAKGTWLFAAPPAFVLADAGETAFLIGITADDANPLPEALRARIRYEDCMRKLSPEVGEDLPELLRDYGLVQLSEQNWLKLPRLETAPVLQERIERQLREQPLSGEVPDLLILDSTRDPTFYRRRWIAPKKQTGTFVARRPQAYGAAIWGFAELAEGALLRFLDLPPKNSRWRGCDHAWHLQMAIDHGRRSPQQYRRRAAAGGSLFDFFSPLPLWAERRLSVVGSRAHALNCLFSYFVPERDVRGEDDFLRDRLWLVPQSVAQ